MDETGPKTPDTGKRSRLRWSAIMALWTAASGLFVFALDCAYKGIKIFEFYSGFSSRESRQPDSPDLKPRPDPCRDSTGSAPTLTLVQVEGISISPEGWSVAKDLPLKCRVRLVAGHLGSKRGLCLGTQTGNAWSRRKVGAIQDSFAETVQLRNTYETQNEWTFRFELEDGCAQSREIPVKLPLPRLKVHTVDGQVPAQSPLRVQPYSDLIVAGNAENLLAGEKITVIIKGLADGNETGAWKGLAEAREDGAWTVHIRIRDGERYHLYYGVADPVEWDAEELLGQLSKLDVELMAASH